MVIQASKTIKKYIQKNWHGFLHIIFPTNCNVCGVDLPENIQHICPNCMHDLNFTHFEKYTESTPAEEIFWGRVKIENVFCLLYFKKDTASQELLHTIKYRNGKDLANYCGELIGYHWMSARSKFEVDAIIPIPLHSKKTFKRGYNQSLLLAEGLQKQLRAPIESCLYRKKHHESQTKKNRFERQDNVKSIFGVDEALLANKKHVLIIDDVLTTGATLEEAAKAILSFNPEIRVSLFTLAMAK